MVNDGFLEIPQEIKTWFLDTCIWSEILTSEKFLNNFVTYFQKNNYLAGLTFYTIIELSRAERLHSALDYLFYKMRHNIWIALMYDSLFESELEAYPSKPIIRWMPLSFLTGDDVQLVNVMTKLANNPDFINSRNDHLDFGRLKFMYLEEFKKNFPVSENSNYTPEQAYTFSRCNAIDYFVRHEPHVLRKIGVRKFLPEGIPSLYARSLFLFYKYYIHGQTTNKSDFLDYAHVSYAPYFNVFASEKNVSNVLNHIKSTGLYFSDIEVLNLTQFLKRIN